MKKSTLRIILITLTILLAFFVLVGWLVCSQSPDPFLPEQTPEIVVPTPTPTPAVIEVESIRIIVENTIMPLGSRFWPEVIIQPYNAADKSYELKSDNELIVRPQGNSWIAAGLGTTNLVATTPCGITATVTVMVTTPELVGLSFQTDEVTMLLEDHLDPVLILMPDNASIENHLRFASDDERIVRVSNEGRITAVGAGTTTVTATVGDIRAELRVTVIIPVRSITIRIDREIYRIGEQVEYGIRVEPENASNSSVSVSYSGARVTSTGTNTFTVEEAGEVTITFSAEGINPATVTIVVVDLEVLANEVFSLTNQERTNAGLPALLRLYTLAQVADLRAGEIIVRLTEDHRRPDGRPWHTILDDYGIDRIGAGENLAAGQKSPAEVVKAWMDSEGHRENILHEEFEYLGIGVTMDHTGRLYWVQLFLN